MIQTHVARGQGEQIHYDSGYSWRAYTGTTEPTCPSKLCHYQPWYDWDEQYTEFAVWKGTSGPNSARMFVNFRVMFPPGYDVKDETTTWPLVVMMHGAGESGRVWTDHFNYEQTDSLYDNNSHHLKYAGREHVIAAGKPASDPRSCRAIVMFAQASYSASWGDMSTLEISEHEAVLLDFIESQMVAKYHADRNRIVAHGLSAGGREIWALATKRPDLFAGIMLMSAVPVNYDLTTSVLRYMPIWIFQGGFDLNPAPTASRDLVRMLEAKGGAPRYTLYEYAAHETWTYAYNEPDFFSWIMDKDQRHIFTGGKSTSLCSDPIRLAGPSGMSAYQWMHDGVEIQGQTYTDYFASTDGSYTVKFQRPSGEWQETDAVSVNVQPGCVVTEVNEEGVANARFYPNPTSDFVYIQSARSIDPSAVRVITASGQLINTPVEASSESELKVDLTHAAQGVYIIRLLDTGEHFRVMRR